MTNYESELSDVLIKYLIEIYSVDKSVVYDYFYLRFLIQYADKINQPFPLRENLLVRFLIRELNLPCDHHQFEYKGEIIYENVAKENSLRNIVVNWHLRALMKSVFTTKGIRLSFDEYIEKEWKCLCRYAQNKAKSYKRQASYFYYFKYHALMLLNKQYSAQPKVPSRIEGITYPEYHHFFVRTLEEVYSAHLHSIERSTTDTHTITEQELEDYLIQHLSLIEDGLRYIDRQVWIKDGRIDVLAMDRESRYVILELKVAEDKELLWQCLYYPSAFQEKEKVKDVRMITIAPDYPKHILHPLKKIKGIEMVQYTPYIKFGKIQSLDIKWVN